MAINHNFIDHKKQFVIQKASDQIIKDEGWRPHVYNDANGIELADHSLRNKGTPTIGFGFNVSDSGPEMPKWLAQDWLEHIIEGDYNHLSVLLNLSRHPLNVQVGLLNMVYNLGISRFSKFEKTIKFLVSRDYYAAADEMLDSKWAKQLPKRSKEISEYISDIDQDTILVQEYVLFLEAKLAEKEK